MNGVELAWFEWNAGQRDAGPPILLAHATGFHARVWDRTVMHLGDRRVISVDQRGHGRSTKVRVDHWRVLGEDLAALIDALDLRSLVAVGHSMGGHALVDAAARSPDRFSRLVLVDPVIVSPEDYAGPAPGPGGVPGAIHPVARRRSHFASVEEMFERFVDRPPYSVFDGAALRDYCEHGLLPGPDGRGFVLACPPEIEASIYQSSRTNAAVLESVRRIDVPVTILRARPRDPDRLDLDFSSSPTWPGLAAAFADAIDVPLPEYSHFIPMEAPALAARFILARDGGDGGED